MIDRRSLAAPVALLLALVARPASAAKDVVVPCGTERTVTLAFPRPLALRIGNHGDCRFRIEVFASSGERVLNDVFLPGETRDIEHRSVSVRTAIVTAFDEPSVVGAVVVLGPMKPGVDIRMPAEFDAFPCDGTARLVYQCDDETDCPRVSYDIRVPDERCGLRLTIFRPGTSDSTNTVPPGSVINLTGRFSEIWVRPLDVASRTCAFTFKRR